MLTLIHDYGNDLASFTVSVALLLIYHGYLHYKVGKNRAYTIQAVNIMARTAWVVTVMREGRDILAVQTLRNSTMAATFLASTSVLLIIGVLTLSGQTDKLEGAWHVLNTVGSKHPELWLAKLLLLLIDLFVAFFSFAMSIRIYNHVGYMINVPLALNHRVISPEHVAVHLNRAGKYYSIGMRAYYFSVPIVFWLFGPHLMLGATILLIAVLYHLDRAPKTLVRDYS
ncbi:MAG: DUF599 domain-containing protein [Betaproteobacteria bacterium]|nr:DUF599 domain-containing protein [Betaproteobacteria bacterium]